MAVQCAKRPKIRWEWIVVLGAFTSQLLSDGISYGFGILYVDLMGTFHGTSATVSSIGSLSFGSFCFIGPIAGALTNKFGYRLVTILGAVLQALGVFLSAFTPNLEFLFFSVGILIGAGGGLMYIASFVCVSEYFDEKRPLATSIASCGSSAGTFLFGFLYRVCIDYYGWRGALIVFSGLMLNGVACGTLYKPANRTLNSLDSGDDDVFLENDGKPEERKNSVKENFKTNGTDKVKVGVEEKSARKESIFTPHAYDPSVNISQLGYRVTTPHKDHLANRQSTEDQSLNALQTDYEAVNASHIVDQSANASHKNDQTENATGIDIQSISAPHINGQLVNSSGIDDQLINASHVYDQSVNASHVDDQSINASHIADQSGDALNIDDQSANASLLNDPLVNASHVDDQSVNASHIDDQSVNASHVDDQSINASNVDDQSVNASHADVQSANASHIDDQSINASHVDDQLVIASHTNDQSANASHIDVQSEDALNIDDQSENASHVYDQPVKASHIDHKLVNASHLDDQVVNRFLHKHLLIVNGNSDHMHIKNANVKFDLITDNENDITTDEIHTVSDVQANATVGKKTSIAAFDLQLELNDDVEISTIDKTSHDDRKDLTEVELPLTKIVSFVLPDNDNIVNEVPTNGDINFIKATEPVLSRRISRQISDIRTVSVASNNLDKGINSQHPSITCSTKSKTISMTSSNVSKASQPFYSRQISRQTLNSIRSRTLSVATLTVGTTNVKLFKEWRFILYALSTFLYCFGYGIPFVLLPDMAEQNGFSSSEAAWVISEFGITAIVGKIVFGFLSQCFTRKVAHANTKLNSVGVLLSGIAIAASPWAISFSILLVIGGIFGFMSAAVNTLVTLVLIELLGEERLADAFGWLNFFGGIGYILGPVVAGWLHDVTGAYFSSFITTGVSLVLSGVVIFPILLSSTGKTGQTSEKQTTDPVQFTRRRSSVCPSVRPSIGL